jgi:hypothetical protein
MTADNRQQFAKLAESLAEAEPRQLPRTWGFEIETPNADTVYGNTTGTEFEVLRFTPDGSVKNEDGFSECSCDCRDCSYHECDCDNCDRYNDSPEHDCGSRYCASLGDYQEITSIGGLDTTHPTALTLLDENGLQDCTVNESCGLHIHIGSADLSPVQVANVVRAYRLIANILEPIAGRRGVYYAEDNTEQDVRLAHEERGTEKYRAVNTRTHFSPAFGRAKTIEFRQHEGTTDTARVRAWAYLLVRLVEFAKTGTGLYWLAKAKDLDEVLQVIR